MVSGSWRTSHPRGTRRPRGSRTRRCSRADPPRIRVGRRSIGCPGHGFVGDGDRARVSRRAQHPDQDVLRMPQRLRGRSQHEHVPDLHGPPRVIAGPERRGDPAHREDRARPRLHDRAPLAVPPQELLLSGHAEELPDQPVRPAHLRRRASRHRPRGRVDEADRDHAGAHGRGHGQDDPRRRRRPHPRGRSLAGRLQPGRRPSGRDRQRARHPVGGAGSRLRGRAAGHRGQGSGATALGPRQS